jgi:hypothetical protein
VATWKKLAAEHGASRSLREKQRRSEGSGRSCRASPLCLPESGQAARRATDGALSTTNASPPPVACLSCVRCPRPWPP